MGLSTAALAAIALPDIIRAAAGGRDRPNILWISCEDMSRELGCYGYENIRTPIIDRLAAQGLKYTNAYTVAPVCAPNRSGIITAMYPNSIGSSHMRTSVKEYQCVPPPYVHCFTEYLRAAGYFCTNNSKTDYQFAPPLTAWDRQGNRHDDWAGRAEGQPFFSVINFTITHESQIRVPLEKDPVKDPATVELPPYYPDTPLVRRDMARYLDNIETMDSQVGEVLDRLERDGLAGSTIVIFWSDHGRGLPRGKRWVYDSGIQIPLIVRWPGMVEPGTESDELVCSIDFGPTALSMAGVEIPAHMQGQAFLGGQKAGPRDYVFAFRDRMDETYDMIRAVRDKRFKYIRNYHPEKPYAQRIEYMDLMPTMQEWRRLAAEGKLVGPQKLFFADTKPVHELYDCDKDPHEIDNLAYDPACAGVLARMQAAMDEWIEEIDDVGFITEDQLIERFWPGRVQPVTRPPRIVPDGGSLRRAVLVGMASPTDGASIAWTSEEGEDVHWNLYSGPLRLTSSAIIRARAIRIGYTESEEVRASFRVD
ncbi:MAG: sulfatase [Candidatus Glassbacteria bacterium]|nr:sulfatase [Candidatus Glassbacteria bacterium]